MSLLLAVQTIKDVANRRVPPVALVVVKTDVQLHLLLITVDANVLLSLARTVSLAAAQVSINSNP